jgi:prevent-host-death family protein
MAITTISSREFNQDVGRAKRAAKRGPVIVTDRGKPAHVLLTIEEYRKITGKQKNLAKLLAMPGGEHIEFEPVRLRPISRPFEFD